MHDSIKNASMEGNDGGQKTRIEIFEEKESC
jgi:hypothetical protein